MYIIECIYMKFHLTQELDRNGMNPCENNSNRLFETSWIICCKRVWRVISPPERKPLGLGWNVRVVGFRIPPRIG